MSDLQPVREMLGGRTRWIVQVTLVDLRVCTPEVYETEALRPDRTG